MAKINQLLAYQLYYNKTLTVKPSPSRGYKG